MASRRAHRTRALTLPVALVAVVAGGVVLLAWNRGTDPVEPGAGVTLDGAVVQVREQPVGVPDPAAAPQAGPDGRGSGVDATPRGDTRQGSGARREPSDPSPSTGREPDPRQRDRAAGSTRPAATQSRPAPTRSRPAAERTEPERADDAARAPRPEADPRPAREPATQRPVAEPPAPRPQAPEPPRPAQAPAPLPVADDDADDDDGVDGDDGGSAGSAGDDDTGPDDADDDGEGSDD